MGGQCRDCRWWRPERVLPYPIRDAAFGAWGYCDLAGTLDGKPGEPLPLAFALDAEWYSADLLTRPDFGCVSWVQDAPPAGGRDG
jgi:hypothetical protein